MTNKLYSTKFNGFTSSSVLKLISLTILFSDYYKVITIEKFKYILCLKWSMTKRKEYYIRERIGYGLDILIPTTISGGVGYGLGKVSDKAGLILDRFHKELIPSLSRTDQKAGRIIVENIPVVGEKIIEVDKVQGDFWSKVFGQTPEKQKEWREKHGIQESSYLPSTTKVIIENIESATTTAQVVQPHDYRKEFNQYNDLILQWSLAFGAIYGLLRGFSKYNYSKRQRQLINETQNLRDEINGLENKILKREKNEN